MKDKKCEEYLNNWKRERADFINYKNDQSKRMKEIAQYAKEEMAVKLIPILDSFDIALKSIPDNDWAKGVLYIKTQIIDLLKSYGIEEIKSENDDFNPKIQEAVEIVEKKGIGPGKVIEEIRKGYIHNGKIIRPAQVKVSK